MIPMRVLVIGLVLSGFVLTSTDHTAVSGAEHERRDTSRDRWWSSRDNATTRLFRLMGKNTIWTHVSTVDMPWQTFHTQGLVKIGETFYVSAVEVIESTVRNGTVTDALYDFSIDRSAGAGRGWLFKFDAAGRLLGQIELTDGTKYHPGGIDYDGEHIWVAVAEYRPNSKSNIYRVHPETLAFELVFAENDHIGGIVHNVHRGTPLHGVSWVRAACMRGTLREGSTSRESCLLIGYRILNSTSTIRTATIRGSSTWCAVVLAAMPLHSAISRSAAWISLTCAAIGSSTRFRSISSSTKARARIPALRSRTMRSGSSRSTTAPCGRIS